MSLGDRRRRRQRESARWASFERRLADGSIRDAVIQLAGGDQVSLDARSPVYLGPGDSVTWQERHGWGWSAGVQPPDAVPTDPEPPAEAGSDAATPRS